jgi:hypothetical protein
MHPLCLAIFKPIHLVFLSIINNFGHTRPCPDLAYALSCAVYLS